MAEHGRVAADLMRRSGHIDDMEEGPQKEQATTALRASLKNAQDFERWLYSSIGVDVDAQPDE
jgi:hypothetical protein